MRRAIGLGVLLSCFAACGGTEPAASAPPPSRAAPEPIAPAPAEPPCERPLAWLARYSRDEMPARYCEACSCGGDRLYWDLLERPETRYCRHLEYAALEVSAHLGRAITDPEWRPYLEAQPWYPPEAASSPAGEENLRWLEQLARACERPTATQRGWVERWFAERRAGRTAIPSRVYLDGAPTTRETIVEWLGQEELFRFDARTPVVSAEGAPGGPGTFTVYTSAPAIDCLAGDEECGAFETIELTFDESGAVTAIAISAAACPFVYVERAGVLEYRGEILRNLNRPELAGEQALTLSEVACEGGPLRVVITEEKPETTYLEALWLDVDGVVVEAREPVRDVVLDEGQRVEAVFDLPAGCARVRAVARGHYVPRYAPREAAQ